MPQDIAILTEKAKLAVSRVLGLIDRKPASPTYGSSDRPYWKYRLKDFSNARAQESALTCALLYTHAIDARFFKKPELRDWAVAAAKWWASLQAGDGSVPEVYPHERSFCATSFTTWAVGETALLLGGAMADLLPSLKKAGRWLAEHDNDLVANQVAAALAALHNLTLLTGDDSFGDAFNKKLEKLAAMQSGGGFFEYGGVDYGYQTVTLSLLSRVARTNKSEKLASMINEGLAALDDAMDGDGRFGRQAGSRRTQFAYPYALVANESPLLAKLAAGLEADVALSPLWMDDRYTVALTNDYLLCLAEGAERCC